MAAARTTPPGDLTMQETDALRSVLQRMKPDRASDDAFERIMTELRDTSPALPEQSVERIAADLQGDPLTQRAVHELLEVSFGWYQTPTDAFTFWWNPRQRRPDGIPCRAPTPGEVRELEDVLRAVSERLGIDVPRPVPYRIDLRASSARVFARSDLRWGITTPHLPDLRAVAEVVLREAADLPYFIEPLGLLAAECRQDAGCEGRVLDAARRAVVGGGYVPVLEGLSAEVLGDVDDPAFASAVLALDHLRRVHPPAVLAALMRGLRRGDTEGEVASVFAREARLSPKRLDREVQRELREWALRQAH